MELRMWKRCLIIVGLAIILNSAVCSVIEYTYLLGEMQDIDSAIKVASSDALQSFNNLEFGTGAAGAEQYDIMDTENNNQYTLYLNNIEHQAKQQGIYNDSDIEAILDFLRLSQSDYRSRRTDTVFNPMQFGYTFLDERIIERRFDHSLREIIAQNYNKDRNGIELAFWGANRINVNTTDVRIVRGPILIDLKHGNVVSDGQYATYTSIFGTARREALEMMGEHEAGRVEYDYVIAYDVEFTVQWQHHTITPFFMNRNYVFDEYLDERNQLIIQMPSTTFTKRYIMTN